MLLLVHQKKKMAEKLLIVFITKTLLRIGDKEMYNLKMLLNELMIVCKEVRARDKFALKIRLEKVTPRITGESVAIKNKVPKWAM